jgi:glutamyl-tRNA synthetase
MQGGCVSEERIRVRVAPSPTGEPHVGTAYVALINYAFARKHGGRFILRIEDTDRERSSKESEKAIIESLRWLGLEWDEGPDVGGDFGPYRQSERVHIYKEFAYRLVEVGAAYPCFCTPKKLEEIRQRQRAMKHNRGYDGTCRMIPAHEAMARIREGEPHTIRLKMPLEGVTMIRDLLHGEVSYPNEQIDDQVLLKSDGFPTYHLANVVDDHLMQVTHVIRAEEWISSTPKHLVLYEAFGWSPPVFVHLPLLRNKDKSKISKRKNPVSIEYYRKIGVLPETLLNFLGLLGHSMPDEREVFSLEEFVREFSFDRIKPGGPVFDLDKLFWLNGMRLRAHSTEEIVRLLRDTVFSEETLKAVVPLLRERIETLGEFMEKAYYFTHPALPISASLFFDAVKGLDADAMISLFKKSLDAMHEIHVFSAQNIEERMRGLANEAGVKTSDLFMLLRIAATGRKATPPLFETLEVLGYPMVRLRLQGAIEEIKKARRPQ